MDKNDVLDYVMNTPGNTNRAVLNSMLGSLEGSKDSGSGGVFFIATDDSGTMNKTWAEISYAIEEEQRLAYSYVSVDGNQVLGIIDAVIETANVFGVDVKAFTASGVVNQVYFASATTEHPSLPQIGPSPA